MARIFNTETIVGFLAVHSRTAYCVQNDKDMKLYTQVEFYKDLLQEKYPKVSIVTKISLIQKNNFDKSKRCNWTMPTNCRKTTIIPCMNEICEKRACKSHSTQICFKCAELQEFRTNNILLFTLIEPKRKYCYYGCKNQTYHKCAITECGQNVCILHSHKLCHDCASSLHQYHTEKIYSRKLTV